MASALERSRHGRIALMLTGGSTPKQVYRELAAVSGLPWDSVEIWFGDERAVPPDHPDSNYGMARAALLEPANVPGRNVHRMEAERTDLRAAVHEYAAALPKSIDVLLLGIGADGHTASLFPHSPLLALLDRDVDIARSPHHEHARMTIMPRVIASAATRVVLATGEAKANAVACALDEHADVAVCPAALARNSCWVLDRAAAQRVMKSETRGEHG
jgi:6-phosphogluconolactonase